MMNQLRQGNPVNINTKKWLSVESVMAKDDPLVQDLIDMGFSELEATKRFYEEGAY